MSTKLIGLAGPRLVGKSTVANMLERRYGFEEKAFADPLKESLIALTGLDRKYFYDQEFKHEHVELISMTPRKLMQLFGTEFVRDTVRKDFWVARMRERLEAAEKAQVISDIRFEDEASLIRELGGVVIVLSRAGVVDESGHKSEEGLRSNDEDLKILLPEGITEADYLVAEILKRRERYEL